jgi:hypothetical protein
MNKLPDWLSWLLLIPASVLVTIAVYPLVQLGNYLFSPDQGMSIYSRIWAIIVGTGLTGYTFVWVAVKVVPNH